MTTFDHNLDGADHQIAELQREQDRWTGGDAYYVGTAVEYAVYLEFGTRHMDPKPFIMPTLHEVKARGVPAFIDVHTRTSVDSINSIDELVETVAFALERRIKEIITAKGLIETGTLRASVQAVRGTPSKLPNADEVDPDATASFEVSA